MKKYYKCKKGSMIGGVCMGISDYYDIDPTITRIVTILLTIATQGFLILVYIALCVCLPYKEIMQKDYKDYYEEANAYRKTSYNSYDINSERMYYTDLGNDSPKDIENKTKSRQFMGILFIVCGIVLMINKYVPAFIKAYLLPGCCLILGFVLLASGIGLNRNKNKNQESNENVNKQNDNTSSRSEI